jgi:hypothetical protein
MVRLLFALGLVVGGCTFDQGGLHSDAAPEHPDANPDCVPTGNEQCNGLDDDCDGPIDEDFPTKDMPCDGADADDCMEGTWVCNPAGDGVVCNDETGDATEVCDGADNDCDGDTDEGFDVGLPCDGLDTDLCQEGQWQCDALGGRECTDATGSTVEVCDLANVGDEDCDGSVNEDWNFTNDSSNCGGCNILCGTANASSTSCITSTCTPVCSAGATDCNGNPVDGCELRNSNPSCNSPAPTDLGSVRGDGTGVATVSRTDYAETWYVAHITESDMGNTGGDIQANVVLTSPANVNYDLYVYCDSSCPAGTLLGSSINPSDPATPTTDTVAVGNNDTNGTDNGFSILIEVRYGSAAACGDFTIAINGNPAVDNGANNCGTP